MCKKKNRCTYNLHLNVIIYHTKIEIKAKPDKKTRDFNTTNNNKRKIVSTVAREQKFGQFGITINPLDI